MNPELRAELSKAFMSVPREGNSLIKEFVEKNSTELTPNELLDLSYLGAAIEERQNMTNLTEGVDAENIRMSLKKLLSDSGDKT